VCIIDPINLPSQKVAAKLGYQPFGQTTYKGNSVIQYERQPPAIL